MENHIKDKRCQTKTEAEPIKSIFYANLWFDVFVGDAFRRKVVESDDGVDQFSTFERSIDNSRRQLKNIVKSFDEQIAT